MRMQVNPNEIIKMIRQGQNPQQLLRNILEGQMKGTPVGDTLLELINTNNTPALEQFARNVVAQRGGDFDSEFNAFKQSLGLK